MFFDAKHLDSILTNTYTTIVSRILLSIYFSKHPEFRLFSRMGADACEIATYLEVLII
uniref:Uncharacterized protein n=1 Tax=Arundo donax TaxID=35708 RepID=A0A0A9DR27_ARUDO